jgi:citrate lyase subunit beta / citryl-CoA lyase
LWVRVNALSSGRLLDDLVTVISEAGAPDGIVLPKVTWPGELAEVAHYLAALEARAGRTAGLTRLIVLAAETAQGLLSLPQYPAAANDSVAVVQRLAGLTWGAEDLGNELGIRGKHDASGKLTFTFQMARSACLLAASAMNIQAIDTVHVDFRDTGGLKRELENARRDGFCAKLAIHPDQVPLINDAFTPTDAERENARRILAAFSASPGVGVVSLDGQMFDRPHLLRAQRIVGLSKSLQEPK